MTKLLAASASASASAGSAAARAETVPGAMSDAPVSPAILSIARLYRSRLPVASAAASAAASSSLSSSSLSSADAAAAATKTTPAPPPALVRLDSSCAPPAAAHASSPSPASPSSPSSSVPRPRVTKFTNVRLVRDHRLVDDDLWICDGKIVDPQSRFWEAQQRNEFAADVIIDCNYLILAPGFIDIQINGAFGVDFSSPADMLPAANPSSPDSTSPDPLTRVARGLLRHGVTSFLPTVITSSPATYHSILPHIDVRDGSPALGANVLGLHMEGPFITVSGAHPVHLMQHRDVVTPAHMESVYGETNMSKIRLITCAPEIAGMRDTVHALREKWSSVEGAQRRQPEQPLEKPAQSAQPEQKQHGHGLCFSMGHSNASFDCSYAALDGGRGMTLLTHLFNAMLPFHHRDPGIIGLLGTNDVDALRHCYYSIIADGIHTHPASVKIAYHTHPHGAIVVTDAMCAMGLSDGAYKLGEMDVQIEPVPEDHNGDGDGVRRRRAVLTGTQTLAGSIARLDECVQNFHRFTSCTLVEAIDAATLHPARALGLDTRKGVLQQGADADLVLLDDALHVRGVWIGGECVWCEELSDEAEEAKEKEEKEERVQPKQRRMRVR